MTSTEAHAGGLRDQPGATLTDDLASTAGAVAGARSPRWLSARQQYDYPSDLRAAVNGQLHGWQRLRRFRQIMHHRSLNTATSHIGANLRAHPETGFRVKVAVDR